MRENSLKQRHFGVLIPSTNTTVEIECRLLPTTYQAHFGRLMSSGAGSFSPSRDEDIDYQSRLLGTARVEMVILAQTSASLSAEDYDDVVTKRMSVGAGVPAITSAQAVGRAVRALGARRVAIVSPYSDAVNEIASGSFIDRIRIGRHDGDAARSEGPNGAADRLRRRDRRNAGTDTHSLRDDVVVVLGKEACRRLGQDHHLDPGRPQQARLIVDVLVSARRETTGAARHEPPDVRLVRRRQESALDLDR